MFHDYLKQFDISAVRKVLIELFKILDTKEQDRDPYDATMLSEFPYVNGGLFREENIEIPNFDEEIVELLLREASDSFDWSSISPTIFGAVFESTLNPETRRSGGMHYTSIENIHKVIDPLFLNGLKKEFAEISEIKQLKLRNQRLTAFQEKLASLKFLDIILQSLIQRREKFKNAPLRCNFRLRCKMCAGLIAVDLFIILWYGLTKGGNVSAR